MIISFFYFVEQTESVWLTTQHEQRNPKVQIQMIIRAVPQAYKDAVIFDELPTEHR
jgi:hypothetical protein